MTTPQQAPTDEVDLLLTPGHHGWGDITLLVRDETHRMNVTYIFEDPIEEFARTMVALINSADTVNMVLHAEPGEYQWVFQRQMDRRHLVDVTLSEPNPFTGKAIYRIAFTIKLTQLVSLVYSELLKIELLIQEPSYQAMRRVILPVEAMTRMCDWLREKHLLRPSRYKA